VDHITTSLERLTELNDEEVSSLEESIISEFDNVGAGDVTPQSVDTMTQLADALDAVRGEGVRRVALAEELATRVAEASARVHGGGDDDTLDAEDTAPVAEDSEIPSEDTDVAPDAEPAVEDAPVEDAPVEAETEEAPVADEVPAEDEAPAVEEAPAEDAPAEEDEPEDEEKKNKNPFAKKDAEASTTTESAAELATQNTTETAAPAEETLEEDVAVDADAEDKAPAESDATDTPVEANADTDPSDAPKEQEEASTVTAAANEPTFEAPADRRAVIVGQEVPVAITAGADIQGYSQGSTLSNMAEVSKAFVSRIRSIRNANGGDGEQLIVASIQSEYPEDRRLTSDYDSNQSKIDAVVGPEALMASGGFATPLQTRYEIFGFGTDVRPVRDSLPKFQADRGGITYITPPVLSSYTNAVGIWTDQNDRDAAGRYDGNVGTPDGPQKNVLIVGSAQKNEELVDAITLQLQFGNLLTRAFPELIARHNELALIQHARQAELNLLSKMNAKSTQVTTTSVIGFARDFLVQVRRAAAAYRSRHRIDRDTQLRAIIPTWVVDAVAADLALNMPGDDNLNVSRAEINSMLAALNVTITESLDQNTFGAQNAGALLEFPDSFTWFLFSEGSFLFLDGGTLDLGLVRDSMLVNTNDYRMFTETFEGLAFVGIESLAITSTIAINGSAAALKEVTPEY
jgi:chemotaxis protein histidine kinase CheA